MYNYSFFLLSLLVANAVGWPWHDNVEQSQTLATYKFINEEGAQPDIPFCKSAVTTSTSTSLSTYVQVCRNGKFVFKILLGGWPGRTHRLMLSMVHIHPG